MARLRKHSNWTVKGPDVKLSLCMALAEAVTPRTEEIRSQSSPSTPLHPFPHAVGKNSLVVDICGFGRHSVLFADIPHARAHHGSSAHFECQCALKWLRKRGLSVRTNRYADSQRQLLRGGMAHCWCFYFSELLSEVRPIHILMIMCTRGYQDWLSRDQCQHQERNDLLK